MKYPGIVLLKEEGHAVSNCCKLLEITTSSFYEWKSGKSEKKSKDGVLKAKILEIFGDSKETYGSPRITRQLARDGERVGKDRVARLMKEEGLSARRKKAFRPTTTITDKNDKKSERIFKIEETTVERQNQVWASDLTYIPTDEGFVYLTVVEDLFNRQIVGWDLSNTMEAENTKNALVNAFRTVSGNLEGLVFHSDQGVQYCSEAVREKLKIVKITQSMSRRGNCYDNAYVESFFHTLKNELQKKKFRNLAEAMKEIFAYIEGWYNTKRMHSSLGYLSPVEYAEQNRHVA